MNLNIVNKPNTVANKRYNKCGYACSLKQLQSLYTFVLTDS